MGILHVISTVQLRRSDIIIIQNKYALLDALALDKEFGENLIENMKRKLYCYAEAGGANGTPSFPLVVYFLYLEGGEWRSGARSCLMMSKTRGQNPVSNCLLTSVYQFLFRASNSKQEMRSYLPTTSNRRMRIRIFGGLRSLRKLL